MRIISKRRLREFWQGRSHDALPAMRNLSTWHKLAKAAGWANFAELRQTFRSADQVGNCVVFDVGNNRYRLIGRVNFRRAIVYVLKIMDHDEYDRRRWVEECGCRKPPPKRSPPQAPNPKSAELRRTKRK